MNDDLEYEDIHRLLSVPETPAGMTRRRFLQAALATGAAAAAAPWLEKAAFAASPLGAGDGIVVVIQMGGGNDGLNTGVPTGDAAYYTKRGTLAISAASALPLVPGCGLHPNLVSLKNRYDAGQVAVVRGVGVPHPDLSHFTSMATWMAGRDATVAGSSPTGWLGRWLDGLDGDDLRGVAIGGSCPLTLVGSRTQGPTLPTGLSGAFGADRRDASDARMYDAIMATAGRATGLGALGDMLGESNAETVKLAGMISGSYTADLPKSGIQRQLGLAAKLINANLGIRVINTTYGPFDTHANQLGTQGQGLADLDAAIDAFYALLDPNWAEAVTIVTWSEFGRRPQFNGSGTDHGTASCLFVVGNRVRGGVYGDQPSLASLDRNGNMVGTVDYRSVYSAVLDQWLAADSTQILGGTFPALPLFADKPFLTPQLPPIFNITPAPTTAPPPPPPPPPVRRKPGYWIVTGAGQVVNYGRDGSYTAPSSKSPIAGIAPTPTRNGGWLVRQDGTVHNFGDAKHYGDMRGKKLNGPMRGITAHPNGKGYWLLGSDGGIFSFGAVAFHGSTGNMHLNAPVVGMAAHPSGNGYWFVASDGGIFTFGPDAGFHGSMGGAHLNQPIVAMAATPSGNGYWLVAADGGVFAFGDAGFYGSTGNIRLNRPIVAMTPTPTGHGYWVVAADGGVFAFGHATFNGSMGGSPPASGVVGIAA